jgi:SAM-dependent methyltransferase
MWEPIGRRQFEFLVEQGLHPHHYLLDVGCGSLRAGIHFVRYLERGHYHGLDIDPRLLRGGRHELRDAGLANKGAILLQSDHFELSRFGRKFDVALAQSVFTHLPFNSIIRCIGEIEQVLVPGGRFFASFFKAESRLLITDRDPFLYEPDIFRWVVAGSSLTVDLLGEWGHPRGGHPMLVFTKSP